MTQFHDLWSHSSSLVLRSRSSLTCPIPSYRMLDGLKLIKSRWRISPKRRKCCKEDIRLIDSYRMEVKMWQHSSKRNMPFKNQKAVVSSVSKLRGFPNLRSKTLPMTSAPATHKLQRRSYTREHSNLRSLILGRMIFLTSQWIRTSSRDPFTT